MRRFFVEGDWKAGEIIRLPKDEGRHLQQVLRLSLNATIEVTNGKGLLGFALIQSMEGGVSVRLEKVWTAPKGSALILLMAVIKGPRLDWVVEKATELGVEQIRLAQTEHSLPLGDRLERWQRISQSAGKQSGNSLFPEIFSPAPLETLLKDLPPGGSRLLFSPMTVDTLAPPDLESSPRVLAIGPEGGFSQEEERLLMRHGFRPFRLHQNILRAETAALAAIAAVDQFIAFSQSKRL
jgi:16S rRNA (uracil1498-N3)-methyltransferase